MQITLISGLVLTLILVAAKLNDLRRELVPVRARRCVISRRPR